MKQLHRKDLFGWSEFDQQRNLDFHSVLWVRESGNILIDPLPMSEHDRLHFKGYNSILTKTVTLITMRLFQCIALGKKKLSINYKSVTIRTSSVPFIRSFLLIKRQN